MIPELCQVGADIHLRHDWSPAGVCRRCGAKLPSGGLTLSQEEVANLVATHPAVIGRLHARPNQQLVVSVEGRVWEVQKK